MDKSNKKSLLAIMVIMAFAVTLTPILLAEPAFATRSEGIIYFSNDSSVAYSIEGGKIKAVMPDIEAKSLITSIDATSDGSLTLTIPRSILDSTMNGEDNDFFVLIDGEEIDFDETITSSSRTLTIQFLKDTKEIHIIGTFLTLPKDTSFSDLYTQATQITLDISDKEAIMGQVIRFSGTLTSNGQPVPNAKIQIQDEDVADVDDYLTSTTTDNNGRFSASWMVGNIDSQDMPNSARLLELASEIHDVSFSNSILSMLEENTIEIYAEFEGSDMYAGSKSCIQNKSYGFTSYSCQNNILVITDAADTTKKTIVNSLLRGMIQSNDPTAQSSALFSALYGRTHSQSSIDSLNDLIVTEFLSTAGTDKQIPKWVNNLPMWYEKGDISRDEMINIIKFMINK